MSLVFRNTSDLAEQERGRKRSFEYGALPDEEKERLCRSLLSEFGVTSLRSNDGELIHNCCLPWHDETHPSASLNYKKLAYKCFGCDSSGGLLWLIGICRDTTSTDARKWLNDQTGMGADEQPLHMLLEFFDHVYSKTGTEESSPIPKLNPDVIKPWMKIHPYLTDPISEGGRGVPEQNIIDLKVGFGTLRMKVGDTWVSSDRIVIPHFWKGNLTGWQSRRLIKDGTGKYQSSPDLPRENTIYNYDPSAKRVVVVESPMSVISKKHVSHIEATFGASVASSQVRHLAKHPEIILFMDNDDAGWEATDKLIAALEPYSIVWVANSDWAADPADMTEEIYQECLDAAVLSSLWRRPTELRQLPSVA